MGFFKLFPHVHWLGYHGARRTRVIQGLGFRTRCGWRSPDLACVGWPSLHTGIADIKVLYPSTCDSKTSLTYFIKVKNDTCVGCMIVASPVGAIACAPCERDRDVQHHGTRRGHGRHHQCMLASPARTCCNGCPEWIVDECA